MNIYQKLIEIRKVVPYLKKEAQGRQYSYTSSSQVLGSLKEKMDELGLVLIPSITGHNVMTETVEYEDKGKPKKTTTYFTELEMTMTWINAENPEEKIEILWYAQGVDIAGEKGVGKALTYAEKYFLLKTFNIATDKDDPDSFQKKHSDDPTPESGTKGENNVVEYKPKDQENQEFNCEDCGSKINKAVNEYSKKYYGKALCRNCQGKNKKTV